MTSDYTDKRRPRVLLCCSGSVATLKVPEIACRLALFSEVRILCSSKAAYHFLRRAWLYNLEVWLNFCMIGGMNLVIDDEDEWGGWDRIGDPVLHIELRRWTDLMIIAPASANLLAKSAVGICDSLMLSTIRAWDISVENRKPCIICPAMNTNMWDHPSTEVACQTLQKWGYIFIYPTVKVLACKDTGKGALAPVSDIIETVKIHMGTIKEYSKYDAVNIPKLNPQWPKSVLFRQRHHFFSEIAGRRGNNRHAIVLSLCTVLVGLPLLGYIMGRNSLIPV